MTRIDELIMEGISAHQTGDLDRAALLYEQAIALNADPLHMSMAHFNLAQALTAGGQLENSITHLQEAVHHDARNLSAWDHLTQLLLREHRYAEAEFSALNALQLHPMDAHLLTRLGIAIASQQRFGEALNYFQQALQLDRNEAEAWAQLGAILFLHNDLGSARDALQTAIALNDQDLNVLRHLALVELRLNNRNGAIAHFERLLRLNPSDHSARLDLAVILLADNQAEAALEQLDCITGPARDATKFMFYQATALQQTGHQEAGRMILQQLSQQQDDPYADKARTLLATC